MVYKYILYIYFILLIMHNTYYNLQIYKEFICNIDIYSYNRFTLTF